MKQKKLISCLKLDSYGVEIVFSQSKQQIICLLNKNNISVNFPTEMQFVIESKLFSLDTIFSIAFCFNDEKLTNITASADTILDDKLSYSRYTEIQKAIENELGAPHNRLWLIINSLVSDNRLACWQNNEIKIEHYLLNRFGIEETIHIEVLS